MASTDSWIPHFDRGLGWNDRSDGSGRRDGRFHAPFSGPFLQEI